MCWHDRLLVREVLMPSDRASGAGDRGERFVALYERCYAPIYAYVLRRLGDEGEAPDVVAEVFAVAWRRIDAVPAEPEDRLWLYGVARRVLARARRGAWRSHRLHARLAADAEVIAAPAGEAGEGSEHAELLAALGRLRPAEQEVVRLLLWEQLSHAEAALVLGCSANAIALRFHKAKARLRNELGVAPAPPPNPAAERDDGHLTTEMARS
jgi:RNA polymerase sigma-70 factor (ECF subfamily)